MKEQDDEIERSIHFLPTPPLPKEAWKMIEEMQKAAKKVSGMNEGLNHGKH